MQQPVVTEYQVTTEYPIAAPIRIAHVSDLHERRADDILALLRRAHPDLIVITGDTFERYDNRPQYDFAHRPIKRLIINAIHYANCLLVRFEPQEKKAETDNARAFLREAVQLAPVCMSLGNHEQLLLDEDVRFIASQGITLLDNADTTITVKGFTFRIGGMSSWDFEDFISAFRAKDGFKLLLCHHPDRFEKYVKESDIDLTLSGHTHGGQFRVGKKGRGFFVPGQGVFGRLAHGSFFDGRLIVSAGCANTVACPRLWNPRELVVVTIRGKE